MKKYLLPTLLVSSLALAFPLQAKEKVINNTKVNQQVTEQVEESVLRAHIAVLASDLFEGRGTGQRGGDLTALYLESQVQALGLKPANGNSYRQLVKIAGVKALPAESNVHIEVDGKPMKLEFGKDWVWAPGDAAASHTFNNEMVFVGYGTTAPEEQWDDFKGQDLKGKLLIMMVNDPQPTAEEANRFAGKALTYYGRWTYKFEEAMRQGAAGVLLIHTTPSASYGWSVVQNGWTSEKFQLNGAAPGTAMQGWITDETARQLFSSAGQNLDQLRAAAEKKDFKPVVLNAKVVGDAKTQIRAVEQYNIAAIVPGTDAALKDEVVIYSAHWDHLGKQGDTGDTIFNGAVDNASGTAALLAIAKVAVQAPSKRSQMFLWVAAEEQGLLGSMYYAEKPLWPLAKTAAALNLDSLNYVGPTRDMSTPGSHRTELGEIAAQVAKNMKMVIAQPTPDMSGGYFRSDHFNFAKAGVPAFSIGGGRDYLNDPAAAKEKAKAYAARYHQVTDEYDPSWDMAGMVQQAQFTMNLGKAIANAKKMPLWKKGEPWGVGRSQ